MNVVYLHGQKEDPDVEHIVFPTGEKHIRIRNLNSVDDVVLVYNDPTGDVMKLGMAVDICRRANVESITLIIPFVPYARQDRIAARGDPFSIRVFANFVNSLNLNRVLMTDPHSEITPALLNNSWVMPQYEVARQAVLLLDEYSVDPIALVAPDLGAAKKIIALRAHLFERYHTTFPIIQCDKTRDVETGKITDFRILDGDPKGFHCLMIDDICDGGGTFLGLSDVLAAAGAGDQSLYVTHGIFSKGIDILKEKFQTIFTSTSFPKTSGTHTIELGEFV